MSDIKWIKLTTNMFDDEKIKIIQSMPEGDSILVIWIRLLVTAGKINADGYIFLSEDIPYTDDMLSIIFGKPVQIIRLALDTLQKLGMIIIDKKGICLVNWEKHQNVEGLERIREKGRERVSRYRERQKKLLECKDNDVTLHNVTDNVTVTHGNDADIEEDIDKEKDIDKIKSIYEFWNGANIIIHKKLTDDMTSSIKSALKDCTEFEIITAIKHYKIMLENTKYELCSYKWSLKEFLGRGKGFKLFLDDGSKWINYCEFINKNNKNNNSSFVDLAGDEDD